MRTASLAAALGLLWIQLAFAAPPPANVILLRVRPADDYVSDLIASGCRKSPTLRQIVDDLAASDLIVYVQRVHHLPQPDLGAVQLIGSFGGQRYVRVSVLGVPDPRRFLATVAHELQHALEIAGHPEVVDDESMEALYRRIGRPSCNGYETDAARSAGETVERELEGRGLPKS